MDNNESNLYKAPDSALETDINDKTEHEYIGPQKRSVGSGMEWISQGFKIFTQSPGAWILTMIVGFIVMIVISLIPIIGSLFTMLTTYVWIAGLVLGCKAVDDGEQMDIKYLFAGFSSHAWKLIGLSLIMTVISVVFMVSAMGTLYLDAIFGGATELPADTDPIALAIRFLIVMALLIPLMMAVWFAPALIVLQEMSILQAMKASFYGCLKNVLPFLIYGIVLMILILVAAIPLFLGMLVVVPMTYGSIYSSYKDIYLKG